MSGLASSEYQRMYLEFLRILEYKTSITKFAMSGSIFPMGSMEYLAKLRCSWNQISISKNLKIS